MVFPITNYTRVWVRGRMVDLAKAQAESTSYGVTGPVQFIPSPGVLVDQGTGQVIDTKPFVVFPSATDGYFQIQLPATNDPDINPTAWTYHVIEPTGRDYHITVPYNTSPLASIGDPLDGQPVIELANVVPNPTADPGTVQVLVGAAGRGISSVAISSGDWVITYSDSTTQNIGPATVPAAISPNIVDAKGDLLTATADNTPDRLAVGTDGRFLVADSSQATGLRWGSLPLVPSPPVSLTDAATIATDASLGNLFKVSVTADRTLGAPSNPTNGQRVMWAVTADASARTLTLATGAGGFIFGTDITALTATAATKTDYIGAIYDSTANRWRVIAYVTGF